MQRVNCVCSTGVAIVALAPLVQMMNTDDNSYVSFCSAYVVDDSIDEDTYDEYKYDDCEDDFYYNSTTGTVLRHHCTVIRSNKIEYLEVKDPKKIHRDI